MKLSIAPILEIIAILYMLSSLSASDNVSPVMKTKDFYLFGDYYMSIKEANKVLKGKYSKSEKEEVLYYINESVEEIILQLEEDVLTTPLKKIKAKVNMYKKDCKFNIKIIEDDYEIKFKYDRKAYKTLLNKYPESDFLERIKLRYLLRESKYFVDPIERYKRNKFIIKKYEKFIKDYPDNEFIPEITIRIADLYLSLFSAAQTDIIKNKLLLKVTEINSYYKKSKELYLYVAKKYPHSKAAHLIGIVKINNVKLREEPTTKSKLLRKLTKGLLVKVLDRSEKKHSISNMYDYWYKVKIPEGIEGWVFGFYLTTGLDR